VLRRRVALTSGAMSVPRAGQPPSSGRPRHLARAGDDVIGLPVVLQPDHHVHALLDPVLVVRVAHAVGGGEEARRAKRIIAQRRPDASELLELVKRANEYGTPSPSHGRPMLGDRRRAHNSDSSGDMGMTIT
jgi:hypothetical protein